MKKTDNIHKKVILSDSTETKLLILVRNVDGDLVADWAISSLNPDKFHRYNEGWFDEDIHLINKPEIE